MPQEAVKTIVGILLESPLYLTLPLKERLETVRRVLNEYDPPRLQGPGGKP